MSPRGARGCPFCSRRPWPANARVAPVFGPNPFRIPLLCSSSAGLSPAVCRVVTPSRARRGCAGGVGDDAPSVRKPSLAIREGALGYRIPQPLPLLKRVFKHRLLCSRLGTGPLLRSVGTEGSDAVYLAAARASSRRVWGRVPPGRRFQRRGAVVVLARSVRAGTRGSLPLRASVGKGGQGGAAPPRPWRVPLPGLPARYRVAAGGALHGHGPEPGSARGVGVSAVGRGSPGSDPAGLWMAGWRRRNRAALSVAWGRVGSRGVARPRWRGLGRM